MAYHFTGQSIRGPPLNNLVLEIIAKVSQIKLEVAAVTSDMGSNNRAMWREFFISSTREMTANYIPHPCSQTLARLYFLADVSHVVKNLRGAFVKHKTFIVADTICPQQNLQNNIVDVGHIKDLIQFQ